MRNLKVLVTGATGFLGRAIVSKLMLADANISVFVLPTDSVPDTWSEPVTVIYGDIRDDDAVKQAVTGMDLVIHLAALVGDWASREAHRDVTVGGTRNLLVAAQQRNVRVILASSVVVYGHHIRNGLCSEETGHGKPMGPYSWAKQEQENWFHFYQKRGLTGCIIRPANIYGPGSGPWLRDVLTQIRRGVPVLVDGGRFNAGLTYVENVADLFLLAADAQHANGQTYNVVDDEDVTWHHYFSDLAGLIGMPQVRSIPRALARPAARVMDSVWRWAGSEQRPPITQEAFNLVAFPNYYCNEKAKRELGWWPKVKYEQGFSVIAHHLRQLGLVSH